MSSEPAGSRASSTSPASSASFMSPAPRALPGRSPVSVALSLARSGRVPGPRFPAGPQTTPWPGPALPVPGPLDRLLRRSLAGGRLRPAASAGALHPVNAHLLLGAGTGLPPGRYAYQPVTHRLHPRGAVDGNVPPGALAVLTVTARRTVSQYGHRGWPLLLLDTGHAAAALVLAGAPAWCPDADGALLAAAAGLPSGRCGEHALAAVRLTPGPEDALAWWAARPPGAPPPPDAHPAPPVLRDAWDVLDALTAPARGRAVPAARGRGGAPYPDAVWRAPGAAVPPEAGTGPNGAEAGPDGAEAGPDGAEAVAARRSAQPPFPGVPDETRLAAVARAAAAAAAAAHPPRGRATGAPAGATATTAGPALAWDLVRADAPGAPRRAEDLARRAAGQAWLTRTGALLLAHGCPDDAGLAHVRHAHLTAGYAVGAAQATAARLGLASRPVGSWQHGPGGPAHLVHALALGTATEGNSPR
ncbi:hypothetical protein [Streptomyces sp. SS162]|uniref:hypothetical protein n=1 Tax=Streptomyces sp. SS162 TaxID=3108484 RepID=UPI002F3F4CD6